MSSDEEMTQVKALVPEDAKEVAKQKLDHGGLSEEIRKTIESIAYGGDVQQRTRLERRRDEIKETLRDLRQERKRIETKIDAEESKLDAVEEEIAALAEREDKYEAKLEELEAKVRIEGARVFADHPAVHRAAKTGGVEPEGVIEELKDRNPDVPEYAFKQALHDERDWHGLPEDVATRPVEERESRGEQ